MSSDSKRWLGGRSKILGPLTIETVRQHRCPYNKSLHWPYTGCKLDKPFGVNIKTQYFVRRDTIPFRSYIKRLFLFVLSSSFCLGLILGIVALVVGEITMRGNLELEFGALDGFWLILGFPVLSTIVFILLSPLSFFVHKLIFKRADHGAPFDA